MLSNRPGLIVLESRGVVILLLAVSFVAVAAPLWHPALHQIRVRNGRRPCYTLIDWLNAVGLG